MRRLTGVPAAPGVARGSWVLVAPLSAPVGGRVEPDAAGAEIERLRAASDAAAGELETIARSVESDGHPDEAQIFLAQASIARDPALISRASDLVRGSGVDGVGAIGAAASSFAEQLRSLDDERLAERATDVIDVALRIARRLSGASDGPVQRFETPAIVVANDLAPSATATLPRDRLLGIALEGASPTAHAAILARAYGIPAVVGVAGLLETLRTETDGRDGVELAIDGSTGEIVIDPDEVTSERFRASGDERRRRHAADVRDARTPAVTLDGLEVDLLANIGGPGESAGAVDLGAGGVGLFRTEFLFLERADAPSESEQLEAYSDVVRAFAPDPVTIRLLDVGGDKPIPYLALPEESNPFLGVRALRLAHARPELFLTQLRACYRAAAAGPVKVMAPMIADARDVDLLLGLAEQARREVGAAGQESGEVRLGVMLEIPSSILVADSYFRTLAFTSLGTNDLLQYALAVDRGNAALERYRDPLHPALLRLVRLAVEAARRAGIDLSVCGEMAGDPAAALALVGLGVGSLSMAPSSLPAVRRAIRAARQEDLRSEAAAALDEPSAEAARARFERLLAPGARG